MDTDVEEKYNNDLWYVLQKIKNGLLRQIGNENIVTYTIFTYPIPKDPSTPHPTQEQLLIKKIEKLRIVKEMDEPDDFIIGDNSKGNPKAAGLTLHLKINPPVFNKVYKKESQKHTNNESILSKIERFCRFENNSLIFQLPDGSLAPIDFHSKRGNKDMLDVFEATFDYWRVSAELKNGWFEANITKDELKKKLVSNGRKDISDNWLKNTISNIRNTKIKQSKLRTLVTFGYFNRKDNGWPFRIKKL